MPFWRSKFRIRIKKTRPTKTGTLRISHAISTLARGQISGGVSRTQSFTGSFKYKLESALEKHNTRSGINLMIQIQTKAKTLGHIENNSKL